MEIRDCGILTWRGTLENQRGGDIGKMTTRERRGWI